MDYIEEESRPKFLFQSRTTPSPSHPPPPFQINKLHTFLCFSTSSLLLFTSFYFLSHSQTLSFLLIWTSLSLLLAPFTPSQFTGGTCHVGRGLPLPDPTPTEPELKQRVRTRYKKQPDHNPNPIIIKPTESSPIKKQNGEKNIEEKEWTDDDIDTLKKQISKHPVGEPRRWEKIAEAFQGRRRLESVIKTAKSLSERRNGDGGDFEKFLKNRKPIDRRAEEAMNGDSNDSVIESWSSGEDIALLNALKVFGKEAAMRWEKVAAAVPGKTKAACVKRVGELKKDFRSSKGSG